LFGGQLNTNSLKTYQATTSSALTGDVNVVNWYDQNGGEDFVNATAGEQPRIVMGSELVTDSNSKASVYFASGETLDCNSLAGQNRLDIYAIQDTSDDNYIYPSDPDNASRYGFSAKDGSGAGSLSSGFGTPSFYANGAVTSYSTRNVAHDVLTGKANLVTQLNASTGTWTKLTFGEYPSSADYNFSGKISEAIFFPNMDSSPKRFPIEQNMLNHFGVNLVTNGGFDEDSGWTKQTGWTISGGKANAVTSGDYVNIYQAGIFEVGKRYKVSFEITDYTQGKIRLTEAGYDVSGFKSAVGTYTTYFTAAHTSVYMQGAESFVGSIDNVTAVEADSDGFVTKLYDQTSNNCHATQETASYQPKLVAGGDLITSGGKPAWEYITGSPQRNLEIQGLAGITDLDAWFVQDGTADTQYMVPSASSSSYYGFAANDASSSTTPTLNYGSPSLEINGVNTGFTDRDDVYDAVAGRKLIYHRSASTTSWPNVQIGWFGTTDNSGWNIKALKFSEIIWYDSDQHGNQAGIESNINTHYNIY